jgi:hypothetical protein
MFATPHRLAWLCTFSGTIPRGAHRAVATQIIVNREHIASSRERFRQSFFAVYFDRLISPVRPQSSLPGW